MRSFEAHCQDGETHTNLYEDFRPRGVTSKALTTGIDEVVYVGGEVVYIHVAQGSSPCSCHSNTKSVRCIRVAITTRQVSAVTNSKAKRKA